MTTPLSRIVQSDTARRNQAMRDMDGLPWAPRAANRFATWLSKTVIFVLLPICTVVWMVSR